MNRLLEYLKNPIYCENKKPKAYYFLFLIFIYVFSIIPIALIAFIILKYFNIEHKTVSDLSTNIILVGALLAPVYEEILFRSLLKFTKQNLIIFVIFIIALLSYFIFRSKVEFAIGISVFLIIVLTSKLIYSTKKIELFIAKYFKYFFYSSAIIFGLVHASNFTGNIYPIIGFSFILGGPQIILGLILGFVRMNYGLIYSILFHLIINSTMLLSLI